MAMWQTEVVLQGLGLLPLYLLPYAIMLTMYRSYIYDFVTGIENHRAIGTIHNICSMLGFALGGIRHPEMTTFWNLHHISSLYSWVCYYLVYSGGCSNWWNFCRLLLKQPLVTKAWPHPIADRLLILMIMLARNSTHCLFNWLHVPMITATGV